MRPFAFLMHRIVVGSLAGLVLACTVWLLAAEAMDPGLGYFPGNAQDAATYSALEARARTAAAIGVVRGDLWSKAAIADASRWLFRPGDQRPKGVSPGDVEGARMIARRAAALSPHDARVWLVLAGLQFQSGGTGESTADDLKLSYYTGPNDFALSPLRLLIAAGISWDDELKGMLQSEILQIILKRPDLKPAIAAAYQSSIPSVRQNLEGILKDADPTLLESAKARSQRQ